MILFFYINYSLNTHYSPSKGLVPEAGTFLERKQNTPDGRAECRCNTCRRATRNKIALLGVGPKVLVDAKIETETCAETLRDTRRNNRTTVYHGTLFAHRQTARNGENDTEYFGEQGLETQYLRDLDTVQVTFDHWDTGSCSSRLNIH